MFEKKKEAENMETIKRLKEAAENSLDPRLVIGYKPMEKDREIKESSIYIEVIDICMALAKNGYNPKCDYDYYDSSERTMYGNAARIRVYSKDNTKNLGEIKFFYAGLSEASLGLLNHHYFEYHTKEYMIQDLPYLIIMANGIIKPQEEVPEWLMICAEVVKTYQPPITNPAWLDQCPEAKEYVNSMF